MKITKIKRTKKIDYRFEYRGIQYNDYFETNEHVGFFTDVKLEKEAKQNTCRGMHYYPTHSMEAFTKKELWEGFVGYVANQGGGIVTCNNKYYRIEKA